MTCEEYQPHLTQYILGDLPDELTEQVRRHVEDCPVCQALVQDLKPTLDLLGDALAGTSTPAMRLTPDRHAAIVAALPERKRSAWVLRSHPRLAMAASILIVVTFTVLIVSSLMPASSRARRKALVLNMEAADKARVQEERIEERLVADYSYKAGVKVGSEDQFEVGAAHESISEVTPADEGIRLGLDLKPDTSIESVPDPVSVVAGTKPPVVHEAILPPGSTGGRDSAPDVMDRAVDEETSMDVGGYAYGNLNGTVPKPKPKRGRPRGGEGDTIIGRVKRGGAKDEKGGEIVLWSHIAGVNTPRSPEIKPVPAPVEPGEDVNFTDDTFGVEAEAVDGWKQRKPPLGQPDPAKTEEKKLKERPPASMTAPAPTAPGLVADNSDLYWRQDDGRPQAEAEESRLRRYSEEESLQLASQSKRTEAARKVQEQQSAGERRKASGVYNDYDRVDRVNAVATKKSASGPVANPSASLEEAVPERKEKLVPLKIELPKPMFVGTPKNIKTENLESAREKAARERELQPHIVDGDTDDDGLKNDYEATLSLGKQSEKGAKAMLGDTPIIGSGLVTDDRGGEADNERYRGRRSNQPVDVSGNALQKALPPKARSASAMAEQAGAMDRDEVTVALGRGTVEALEQGEDDNALAHGKSKPIEKYAPEGEPVETFSRTPGGESEKREDDKKWGGYKSDRAEVMMEKPESVEDGYEGGEKDLLVQVVAVDEEIEKEVTRPESDGKSYFVAVPFNPFVSAKDQAFSTFSIDVDTAAYTLARNYMRRGLLPPPESVRTEEFINFFDYGYRAPESKTFAVHATYAPSPFGRGLQVLKIGVKGRRLGREEQRGAVLTVLVDTSGSMDKPDRMGLLQTSLKMLVGALSPTDEIAFLQYDSHARLVLEHTRVSEKKKILAAIDAMQCGGSTNLEEGMLRGYSAAASAFRPGAENRVLLMSDGVANLGSGNAEQILQTVEKYRRQGIQCSVFGFGMGTYDDAMLETLANKGNGNYAFIDSESEARRLLVEDLGATLNTIASDVKIQVEFNPKYVRRYRQLGYENRQLDKEDFRNDAVDAGEVGSGQSVTALYEVDTSKVSADEPLATVRVRYRRSDTGQIEEVAHAVGVGSGVRRFRDTVPQFRLAAAVAEFAEILRESPHARGSDAADLGPMVRAVAAELPLDSRISELRALVEAVPGLSRAGE